MPPLTNYTSVPTNVSFLEKDLADTVSYPRVGWAPSPTSLLSCPRGRLLITGDRTTNTHRPYRRITRDFQATPKARTEGWTTPAHPNLPQPPHRPPQMCLPRPSVGWFWSRRAHRQKSAVKSPHDLTSTALSWGDGPAPWQWQPRTAMPSSCVNSFLPVTFASVLAQALPPPGHSPGVSVPELESCTGHRPQKPASFPSLLSGTLQPP